MRKDSLQRLVGVVQQLADKHPELLPRFFRARKRSELRAIHLAMGIGFEEDPRRLTRKLKKANARRMREAIKMGIEGHGALLWTTWPGRYADPPAPPPVLVNTISQLVHLRMRRFAAKFHLYSPLDVIALQDAPRPMWNFPAAKSERSPKEPKKMHMPDELASLGDQ